MPTTATPTWATRVQIKADSHHNPAMRAALHAGLWDVTPDNHGNITARLTVAAPTTHEAASLAWRRVRDAAAGLGLDAEPHAVHVVPEDQAECVEPTGVYASGDAAAYLDVSSPRFTALVKALRGRAEARFPLPFAITSSGSLYREHELWRYRQQRPRGSGRTGAWHMITGVQIADTFWGGRAGMSRSFTAPVPDAFVRAGQSAIWSARPVSPEEHARAEDADEPVIYDGNIPHLLSPTVRDALDTP